MFKSYEQIESFFSERKQFGIKLGLGRMHRLLNLLGNPQDDIKGIHVAGTNGKGSTITYLENALINNSYDVGVFTSPSLTDLTGHIFLNGKEISKETFTRIFNHIYPAIKQLDKEGDHPTEFEIITCLAFVYFSNHTEIALIETGMGGLEDTTNCFDPILSIITNISKDHTSFLGDTIAKITEHKSGIIKQNRPVITGVTDGEASKILENIANDKQATLYQLNRHFTYTKLKRDLKQQTFTWKYDNQVFNMALQVSGDHQLINSSLAMMALLLLNELGFSNDMNKSIISIRNTSLPGRFEIVNKSPLIILDGAHNVAGMKAFLNTVKTFDENGTKHLLFAGFKDKDLHGMLNMTSPYFTSITLTSFNHSRASKAEDLYYLVDNEQLSVAQDWKEEVNKMLDLNADKEATYFITGSLHFIAIVRAYFRKLSI